MSRDFDSAARRAAVGLRRAMEVAELTAVPPGVVSQSRPWTAVLRPVLAAALLVVGSAVGVALVMDSSPPPPMAPPATTTTTMATTLPTPTTAAMPPTTADEPAPAAYVVPATSTTTTDPPDLDPPLLDITSPEDGQIFERREVAFEGITEPGAQVFAGKYEADVNSNGEWRIVLILNEGSNVARFVARDPAGNESEASVTVFYVVELPTTTTSTTTIEEKLAEFTANASYGSCSETPPYDVYYGTGQPGSIVKITSEYGSASVEVGAKGHWERKVIFENAPGGEPFIVHLRDEFGREADFEFVYTP